MNRLANKKVVAILRLKCKKMRKKHLLVSVDGWTVQKKICYMKKSCKNHLKFQILNLQVDSRFKLISFYQPVPS